MKIVSGGQTGADRAALDVAIALSIPYGGWCPKGGWAEDMPNPPGLLNCYFQLKETESNDPAERTQFNVRDSNATLVVITESSQNTSPGTLLTRKTAEKLQRPILIIPADQSEAANKLEEWLSKLNVEIFNVAGPRESEAPGLYLLTRALLEKVFSPNIDSAHSGSNSLQ